MALRSAQIKARSPSLIRLVLDRGYARSWIRASENAHLPGTWVNRANKPPPLSLTMRSVSYAEP